MLYSRIFCNFCSPSRHKILKDIGLRSDPALLRVKGSERKATTCSTRYVSEHPTAEVDGLEMVREGLKKKRGGKYGLLPSRPRTQFLLLKIASLMAETNLSLVPFQKQLNFLFNTGLLFPRIPDLRTIFKAALMAVDRGGGTDSPKLHFFVLYSKFIFYGQL